MAVSLSIIGFNMREEIPKESIKFDKEINRLVVTLDDGTEIEISPKDVRDQLPILDKEEKVRDLFMMIHDIEREKFTRMKYFITKMKELEKGIEDARTALGKCNKAVCVKKMQVMIKSYVDSKNALAEIRRTVGLLEKEKKPLRMRIASLGHDPDDFI